MDRPNLNICDGGAAAAFTNPVIFADVPDRRTRRVNDPRSPRTPSASVAETQTPHPRTRPGHSPSPSSKSLPTTRSVPPTPTCQRARQLTRRSRGPSIQAGIARRQRVPRDVPKSAASRSCANTPVEHVLYGDSPGPATTSARRWACPSTTRANRYAIIVACLRSLSPVVSWTSGGSWRSFALPAGRGATAMTGRITPGDGVPASSSRWRDTSTTIATTGTPA
jgi:hypothetical protein